MATRSATDSERPASVAPATMRAVVARRYGTPEVVSIEEVPNITVSLVSLTLMSSVPSTASSS